MAHIQKLVRPSTEPAILIVSPDIPNITKPPRLKVTFRLVLTRATE